MVFVYAGCTDDSYYQNSNCHLLALIIEAVSENPYTEYFAQNFLTPLSITRTRISHLRAEGFSDANGPLIEAASYSNISPHNRFNGNSFDLTDRSDWITAPLPSMAQAHGQSRLSTLSSFLFGGRESCQPSSPHRHFV
jgi:CubicO group peptidase (beta-lactamase class C family)